MGMTIKEAPLVEQLSGKEKIPISDGSNEPRAVDIEQIKEFANKDIEIPIKVSELENDSGYATSKEVEDSISKIPTPDVGGQISAALVDYVKKVEGKGLSTNDFTNELKEKLEDITPYDPSELEDEIGKLETALNTLVGSNVSNAIESFNEIIAFLKNVSDKETLGGILAGITSSIPTKTSQLENDSTFVTQEGLEDALANVKPSDEINEQLDNIRIEKASRIGVKDMTVYLFATKEDKILWQENGAETWIDAEPIELLDKTIKLTLLSGENPYFTVKQEKAEIEVAFQSFMKTVVATEYTEVIEDVLFSVSVDKGAQGNFEKVIVNSPVMYGKTFVADLKSYLAIGENRVLIEATGVTSKARGQLYMTANLTSMYLSAANFTWNIPFIEGQGYNLGGMSIGGNLSKVLHVKVTGEDYEKSYEVNLGTNQYIDKAYFFTGMEFPNATGIYRTEIWLDASGLESEHLVYDIMCIASADQGTAQLVSVRKTIDKASNYSDNILFEYVAYNKGESSASPLVKIAVKGNVLVEETLQGVKTETIIPYSLSLELESEEVDMVLTAEMEFCNKVVIEYPIDNTLSFPATSGAVFYMNPSTRSNSQANRDKVINVVDGSEIATQTTKMAYYDGVDGYTTDEEGRKCLVIPAHSKMVIDYAPLASFSGGKTICFTYKVRNVADYSEPVITVCDNPTSKIFKGIRINPTNILLHSGDLRTSDLTQGINTSDETMVNVIITLIRSYKVTYGNLAQIYINGCKARSFEFESNDDWTTNTKIILGNSSSDLYVYGIHSYDVGFDKMDSERNFINSLGSSEAKQLMYSLINSVRDDLGNISYDKVFGKYNTFEVEMLNGGTLPHHGLSKEYHALCNVEFNFVNLPREYQVKAWRFILKKCRIEGQGTTSMNYWIWNLRFRLDKSDELVVIYPDGIEEIIN